MRDKNTHTHTQTCIGRHLDVSLCGIDVCFKTPSFLRACCVPTNIIVSTNTAFKVDVSHESVSRWVESTYPPRFPFKPWPFHRLKSYVF